MVTRSSILNGLEREFLRSKCLNNINRARSVVVLHFFLSRGRMVSTVGFRSDNLPDEYLQPGGAHSLQGTQSTRGSFVEQWATYRCRPANRGRSCGSPTRRCEATAAVDTFFGFRRAP